MRSTAHCKLDGLPAEILSLLPGKTVYCSFSGGADSLALLLFLKEWSRRFSFTLEAVHFEHGFRGADSLADAKFCRTVCEREAIPFQLFRINVPKHRLKGEGDEEAARRLRLDYWRKIVRNPVNSLIAVGHHADDRTENVLLRLFRGSNASGLSSMRAVQKLGNMTLIRPFIEFTRADIEVWLTARGETSWRHDSTNDSARYRRNFLRLELLPVIAKQFPFAPDGIRQSIRTLEADAVCLERLAQQEFDRLKDRMDCGELAAIPAALRARILRRFLQQELQQVSFVPDSRLLERFEKLIAAPRSSARIPLRGFPGRMLVLRHGVFLVQAKPAAASAEIIWDPLKSELCEWDSELTFRSERIPADRIIYSRDKTSAYFDADELKKLLPLRLTDWKPGDRIVPFGKQHPVLLKKLFADAGIGTAERSAYPVIRGADGTILWAALLRNGNIATVTEKTGEVLRLFVIQKHLQHQR